MSSTLHHTRLSSHLLILIPSGEAYLTQMPFFQGLYDLPEAGAITPNYTLDLLGDYAATRCKSPIPRRMPSPSLNMERPRINFPESVLFPRFFRLLHSSWYPSIHLPYAIQQVCRLPRRVPRSEYAEILLRHVGHG